LEKEVYPRKRSGGEDLSDQSPGRRTDNSLLGPEKDAVRDQKFHF